MQVRIIEKNTQNQITVQEYEKLIEAGEIFSVSSTVKDEIEELVFRYATTEEKQQFKQAMTEAEIMATEEWQTRQRKISALKRELSELSHDIMQDLFGQLVTDLENRKSRAREVHNQIRQLEEKVSRESK